MALPKKGTRKIIVNDIAYRWKGIGWNDEGENFADLWIEHIEGKGQTIKASYTFSILREVYRKVNHKLWGFLDAPPPYIVRQTILYALKNGWQPTKSVPFLDLGNLDEKIDYSQMKEQKPATN